MPKRGRGDAGVDVVRAGDLVEQLTLAQRHAVGGLAQALAEDGCTVDQWLVLRALAATDGLRMGTLAAALVIPRPTLTRVVDALSERALVYRRQSADDARRIAVHLSRQGRSRLDRLNALAQAHEDALRNAPDWQRRCADLLAGAADQRARTSR